MRPKTPSSTPGYVELARQFIPWTDEDATVETASLWERSHQGSWDWEKLLEHQRIVVLAEAGSGKSKELEERTRILAAEGKTVFHLTVQDLAKDGLSVALTSAKRAELEHWRTSGERAYFFLDSIDEAKLDSIRIETAFKKLADGIDGALDRSMIIFSGRYTDWEFRSDLHRFETMLPATTKQDAPDVPITEILSQILDGKWSKKRPQTAERPLVVLMASLNKEQIRSFARSRGVQDVESFIAAIDADDLWELAHRPLDLGWLVDYWQDNKRFGTLAEMLEASLIERLKETNPGLARKDPLSDDEALRAMERVGAAMVFGRVDRIVIPEPEVTASEGDFRLEKILPC